MPNEEFYCGQEDRLIGPRCKKQCIECSSPDRPDEDEEDDFDTDCARDERLDDPRRGQAEGINRMNRKPL